MQASAEALYSCLLADLQENGIDEGVLNSSPPYHNLTFKEAAGCSIKRSLLKKYQQANTDILDSRALLKFLESNFRCKNWMLPELSDHDKILVGELKRALYDFWNEHGEPLVLSDSSLFLQGRVGPGSAIGARGTDFYSKLFSSPLTCTSQYLIRLYKHDSSATILWQEGEILRSESFGPASIVEGNRLSFVPKDKTVSRVICVEPNLNMFYQLGLAGVLVRRIQSFFGKKLEDQPFYNRELARTGSQGFGHVTIDLASASDSISSKMLNEFLPADFMSLLNRLRSPSCLVPGVGNVSLDMVSSMGNGFTFPLQTIFFSCIVLASARMRGIKLSARALVGRDSWGVFGDDIVIHRELYDDVIRLLDITGFTVNQDKSFFEGPFRESCGHDYFDGRNLRGVYIKKIDTPQDFYSAINQLNLFSTRSGITLRRTVHYCLQFVRWNVVPRWENDDSGIKVPFSFLRGTMPCDVRTGSILYFPYRAQGVRIRIFEDRLKIPRASKSLIFNPPGLILAFLQGSVNSCSISVRLNRVRYKRERCIAPNWDYCSSWLPTIQTGQPLEGWFNWQRWETAVHLNI